MPRARHALHGPHGGRSARPARAVARPVHAQGGAPLPPHPLPRPDLCRALDQGGLAGDPLRPAGLRRPARALQAQVEGRRARPRRGPRRSLHQHGARPPGLHRPPGQHHRGGGAPRRRGRRRRRRRPRCQANAAALPGARERAHRDGAARQGGRGHRPLARQGSGGEGQRCGGRAPLGRRGAARRRDRGSLQHRASGRCSRPEGQGGVRGASQGGCRRDGRGGCPAQEEAPSCQGGVCGLGRGRRGGGRRRRHARRPGAHGRPQRRLRHPRPGGCRLPAAVLGRRRARDAPPRRRRRRLGGR
mmetsp:Transcript_14776/g.55694  ORF Transcript_14776/g.55694 Transcript_14776/m.55694 type:complete len:302 (-) Transcript_14776:928-1833(-)